MRPSRIFFKMSDLIFHYPRNYKRFADVVRENNLVYDDRYGNLTMADVYYNPKKKEGKYPVFINVHGGGFVRGDKRHRASFCSFFADQGWFVFNINHRLAPQYPLPAAMEDTLNAMNYLLTITDKYDLDTDKIVLSGDSAGGYYASAAVVASVDEEYRKKLNLPAFNGKVRALVPFCATFDLLKTTLRPTPMNVSKDVAECLLGFKIKDDGSNLSDFPFLNEINLLNYVSDKWPETFIVTAAKDSFCGGQGEMLEEKLLAVGAKVSSYHAKDYNEGHCFHLLPFLKGAKVCWQKVVEFLDTIKE